MDLEQKSKPDIWQQHIDDWRQSKLSQKEYCQRNDISFSSFSYWRTRFNRVAKSSRKFIPVSGGSSHSVICLFLPGGLRLDVPSHALAEVLPIVYRATQ